MAALLSVSTVDATCGAALCVSTEVDVEAVVRSRHRSANHSGDAQLGAGEDPATELETPATPSFSRSSTPTLQHLVETIVARGFPS